MLLFCLQFKIHLQDPYSRTLPYLVIYCTVVQHPASGQHQPGADPTFSTTSVHMRWNPGTFLQVPDVNPSWWWLLMANVEDAEEDSFND